MPPLCRIIYPKNTGDEQIMLTLTAAGKSNSDIEKLLQEASGDEELKILIDGPAQASEIKKLLEDSGFNDVVPEDDEGMLYLLATKKPLEPDTPKAPLQKVSIIPPASPNSTGIFIAGDRGSFLHKVLDSLASASIKPDVIGLVNNAVKLAAYNSKSCSSLKKLEADGAKILVSDACADRMGITEALGTGMLCDMSGIFDAVFACGKVISL